VVSKERKNKQNLNFIDGGGEKNKKERENEGSDHGEG